MATKNSSKKEPAKNDAQTAKRPTIQAESGIDFNTFRPKPAYSKEMPDGKLPYA